MKQRSTPGYEEAEAAYRLGAQPSYPGFPDYLTSQLSASQLPSVSHDVEQYAADFAALNHAAWSVAHHRTVQHNLMNKLS